MQFLNDLTASEAERLIGEMAKLRNGMAVGNFECYLRELEKQSFSRPAIQFIIGLCAIFWGRASFEGMDFEFQDELLIVAGDKCTTRSLVALPAYSIVEKQCSKLGSQWLNAMSREYSSECAELATRFDAGPIIGEIELANPTIRVDAI